MANILGNQQPQAPKLQIDINQSNAVVCQECGYDTFVGGMKVRKISKLLVGADQDVLIPVDVFLCGACGEVCTELLPEQFKQLKD